MILSRARVGVGLLLLLVSSLSACARAPIPTSEQPTPPPTSVPLAGLAIAARPSSTATHELSLTPSLTPAVAVPFDTLTPTALPAIAQTPVSYERNPRAILIEADITGSAGSVPRDMHLPTFRLYADGFLVRAGERTSLATGFDAEVHTGRLSDNEIQEIFAYLTATGFFSLSPFYEPRPAPPNLPTARISVYLNKAKTVTVYGPGFPGTPQTFFDAFNRITRIKPNDDKVFVPSDAYLVATPAGSANEAKSLGDIAEWNSSIGQSLSGATDGVTISGTAFSNATLLISKSPRMLFREGNQVFRVRIAPNAPRSVHLTDWVGTILQGVREFEGRAFDLVGYYRGGNLLGEAGGNPPSPDAWVIADDSGAMYVNGATPSQLDANSRAGLWTVVRLRAVVVYIRNGTSYLVARSVSLQ